MSARLRSTLPPTIRVPATTDRELLGALAHELRNPLAPLSNCLSVIEASRRSRSEIGAALALMRRQLDKLTTLAEELSDAAWLDSILVRPERLDLSELLRDVVERCASSDQRVDTTHVGRAPVFVDGDRAHLARLLGMLIAAAARATKRASVSLRVEADEVQVFVAAEQQGALVVELFTEEPGARARVSRLVIERIVALHGGRIRALGHAFQLRLPLAREAPVSRA